MEGHWIFLEGPTYIVGLAGCGMGLKIEGGCGIQKDFEAGCGMKLSCRDWDTLFFAVAIAGWEMVNGGMGDCKNHQMTEKRQTMTFI